MDLHTRIEKLLSEIFSDMYDCKVTLRFVPKDEMKEEAHVHDHQ